MNPTIIHEDTDFLVIDKPHGMPSAPLSSTDTENVFSIIAKDYPEILNIKGKKSIEGGLVHRIDTDTRGLLLIARTQNAYDNFMQQQLECKFIKHYTAHCFSASSVFALKLPYIITSRFRPFGEGRKMVQPVFDTSGTAAQKKASPKFYSTEIYSIQQKNSVMVIDCKITEGYRHQVRSHLSSLGLKIINDALYGSIIDNNSMQFYAKKLEFYHPRTNNYCNYEL